MATWIRFSCGLCAVVLGALAVRDWAVGSLDIVWATAVVLFAGFYAYDKFVE